MKVSGIMIVILAISASAYDKSHFPDHSGPLYKDAEGDAGWPGTSAGQSSWRPVQRVSLLWGDVNVLIQCKAFIAVHILANPKTSAIPIITGHYRCSSSYGE